MHREITRQYRLCIFIMFIAAFFVMVQGPLFVNSDGLSAEEMARFKSSPKDEEIRQLTSALTSDVEFPISADQALLEAQERRLRDVEVQVLARLEESSKANDKGQAISSVVNSSSDEPTISTSKRTVVLYDGEDEAAAQIDLSEKGEVVATTEPDHTQSIVTRGNKPEMVPDLPRSTVREKEQLPVISSDPEVSVVDLDSLRRDFREIRQRLSIQENLLHSIDQSLVEIAAERSRERAVWDDDRDLATPEIASLTPVPSKVESEAPSELARYAPGVGIKSEVAGLDYANINTRRASVYTGPAQFDSAIFNLYEGTKVRVLERRGEWARITAPNGVKGWIRERYLG